MYMYNTRSAVRSICIYTINKLIKCFVPGTRWICSFTFHLTVRFPRYIESESASSVLISLHHHQPHVSDSSPCVSASYVQRTIKHRGVALLDAFGFHLIIVFFFRLYLRVKSHTRRIE